MGIATKPYLTIDDSVRVKDIPSAVPIEVPGVVHYALDHWDTKRRDDAIGYEPVDGGYRIWISVVDMDSFLGLRSRRKYERVALLPQGRVQSFKEGLNAATTMEFLTDMRKVYEPTLYRSLINVETYSHELTDKRKSELDALAADYDITPKSLLEAPIVPEKIAQDIKHLSRASTTEEAVEKLMVQGHYLFDNYCRHKGLYVPYATVKKEGSFGYTAEPTDSSRVQVTSPIWRKPDRWANYQILGMLTNNHPVLGREPINHFCQMYTNAVQSRTHRQLQAA